MEDVLAAGGHAADMEVSDNWPVDEAALRLWVLSRVVDLMEERCHELAQGMTERCSGRAPRSFVFGPFVLIPERQLLLNGKTPVRIGSRALDILTALVERAGELVCKRDLFSRVWPDTFVEEGNLKVNVAGLRRALGEAPGQAQYIATVPGRGYRFVAACSTPMSRAAVPRPWRIGPASRLRTQARPAPARERLAGGL